MDPISIVVVSGFATFSFIGYCYVQSHVRSLNRRLDGMNDAIKSINQSLDTMADRFKVHCDFVDAKNANQDTHVHDQFYRLRHMFKICDELNDELDMNSSINYYKSMVVDLENVKKAKNDANKTKGRNAKGG